MKVTDPNLCDVWFKALLERDSHFTGVFFAGVITTGVFCIATCRARKPRRENVEFHSDVKSVLDAGFRPCKICRPTRHAYAMPDFIEAALGLLQESENRRIRDAELRERGISPERVRRWFLRHYGVTFQALQRMLRINTAFQELKERGSVTRAALDAGYQSLSGFSYMFKKHNLGAPSQLGETIEMQRFTTRLGPMVICASSVGICLLEFTDRRMLESELKDIQQRLKAPLVYGENRFISQAKREIAEYFDGTRQTFSVALDTPGSPFQRAVWEQLRSIPYAATASYQQQATAMHKPTAVRAVANANGANRVAIIIPCHRVIGKNGALTGYGGGLARKRWLLEHEQRVYQNGCRREE